jgi:hypothetical protein
MAATGSSQANGVRAVLEIDIRELLSVVVAHDKARGLFFDGPRRREAAWGGHSISRFFRRLSPFPFAGRPIVAGDAALDHFVAPLIARHDERGEIAAAEAKRAERHHNDDLQQQLAHDRP